jgi:hypothetical protein
MEFLRFTFLRLRISNFVLSNALNNEYGIVNYIHTLYSNKVNQNCYTDIGESTVPEHMFGNNLGSCRCIRHGGSHLNAPWFEFNSYRKLFVFW